MKGLAAAQRVVKRRLEIATRDPELGDLVAIADKAGYDAGRRIPLFLDRLDYNRTLPLGYEIYWADGVHRVRKT